MLPEPHRWPCGYTFCPAVVRMISAIPIKLNAMVAMADMPRGTFQTRREMVGTPRRKMPRISDKQIKEVWARTDVTKAYLATTLGISDRQLWKKAKALELPPRKGGQRLKTKWPEDFTELWLAGVTTFDLARAAGCSPGNATLEAARRGLPLRLRNPDWCMAKRVSLDQYRQAQLGAAMAADRARERKQA